MSICKRLCYFSTPSGECKKADNVPCPLEVPVVKGKWILVAKRMDICVYRCSCCSIPRDEQTRYCPSCGAKMEVRHD